MTLGKMPGLDVLRGLAIVMVLVCHGLDPSSGTVFRDYHSPLMSLVEWITASGRFGVHLFFVLSGFLITGILVDSRGTADFYRNFYLRRVLRIVPAYVALLAVLLGGRFITWRYVAISLLYLCNMPGLLRGIPEYGPLWSLSVEEQFYLVWPFVVRRLSLRGLAIVSVLVVAFTPALRFALLYGPPVLHDLEKKTWVVGDFFAAGALIALAMRSSHLRPRLARIAAGCIAAGVALFVLAWFPAAFTGSTADRFRLAFALEPVLLLFSGLILFAALQPRLAHGPVARPLLFLGKISYGLYLCHQLVFALVYSHWPFPPIPAVGPYPQLIPRFLVASALSIAVATLSRNTLEEFFLRLKPKHVPPGEPGRAAGQMT